MAAELISARLSSGQDLTSSDKTLDAGRPSLELTILMPCLNEAETIEVCVRKALGFFKRTGISGEVLIADNGSTDGSQGPPVAEPCITPPEIRFSNSATVVFVAMVTNVLLDKLELDVES